MKIATDAHTGADQPFATQALLAEAATLTIPGEITFRLPDGERGWYKHGYRLEHDGTQDWRSFYGLQMQLYMEQDVLLTLDVSLSSAHPETVMAHVSVIGAGWHTITLPWSAFEFDQARTSFLRFVKEVRIVCRTEQDSVDRQIKLRNVRAIRGEVLALVSPHQGKAVASGQRAEYTVYVGNCTDQSQAVSLHMARYGWEAMTAHVEPSHLILAPNEIKEALVRVIVSERIPSGGHETQTLRAIPNGDGARSATVTFITASRMPHPYILHTPSRWQDVRDKVRHYAWAADAQADYVRRAEAWDVPEIALPPHNDPDDTWGSFLFATRHEQDLMACGIAYQLTGDTRYADKIALFLRRLSDPSHGYPKTLRGSNQSLVQEGHFFQHIAMAYDMVQPSSVFSELDVAQIEHTFRLYIETIRYEMAKGAINNWNIAEIIGAFYCALAMQDLATAERFFSGPSGIKEQLARGTMDDGWWYECSIGYNAWCASEFCQVALAYAVWGVNFADMQLPASYSSQVALSAPDGRVELAGGVTDSIDLNALVRPFGMSKEIWGPMRRPSRQIRDLWNSLLPFTDYRGVLLGVNDSTEYLVGRYRFEANVQPFELAYYVFRDPAYAAMINPDGQRDLLYGVPELPSTLPEHFRQSAYADNVGLVMLRSQTPDRPMREQIQAALHYGTHGWAHGHFDRTGLLSLMRYGRSFYNPEAVWYAYEPFMYKFYVQTSVSKNMVVVDQKMQEATPGERLLFYTGKMMQVTVVQTEARWSNPPYGGMVYDYVPVKTFEEKTWREGRYVPIPAEPPAYGALTDYTEPILQRRMLIVTDDYIVLIDYLKGETSHTFESLFQMKGIQGLDAADKNHLRHDAQWNPDPVSSAQFVTDCDWYQVTAPARARFAMRWGEDADNAGTYAPYSEDGRLQLDVHSLWPPQQDIMLGTAPEYFDVQKRLFYRVHSNDIPLAEGKFGAWILGQDEIDVPIAGLQHLDLETRIEITKSELAPPSDHASYTEPTIFWANAHIITRDGQEIPLTQLPMTFTNVLQPPQPNRDYFDGPIKIAGMQYDSAVAGEPVDPAQIGRVYVDLSSVDAARFRAVIGGDYPLGDETQRRKTIAVRTEGTTARFLTIIEPFEDQRMIVRANALHESQIRVELTDGRVQDLTISNFEGSGQGITVTITESIEKKTLRSETINPQSTEPSYQFDDC